MKSSVVDDLGPVVGERWKRQQNQTQAFRFSIPLPSTPLPIYEWVIDHCDDLDWTNAEFVLMDEQVDGSQHPFRYVDASDEASYEGFAQRHLLDGVRMRANVTVPGVKPDLARIDAFDVDVCGFSVPLQPSRGAIRISRKRISRIDVGRSARAGSSFLRHPIAASVWTRNESADSR